MPLNAPARPRRGAGFTLIEVLVVLAVFGLLLGTIISPLVTQFQVREVRESRSAMERVQQALIGFAQASGRLPCPDTTSPPDGTEDCGGAGTSLGGVLPWQTLGVPPADRWGRVYLYRVTTEFTNAAIPGAVAATSQTDLTDSGNISVNGGRDDTKAQVTVTTTAAAVVVSTGSNGHCGTRPDGSTLAAPDQGTRWGCGGLAGAGAADEYENVDGDAVFVDRQRSEGGDACDDAAGSAGPLCAYDDQLVWVPTTILMGKLVEAGQLP